MTDIYFVVYSVQYSVAELQEFRVHDRVLYVLVPVIFPPLNKLVPPNYTLSTLVPSKVDAPPYLFGNGPIPVSFPDGIVDRLGLVPSLLDHDVRQISG